MPGTFSFHIPTLAGPGGHTTDNRAFYDAYAPALNLPHNLSALNGNPNVNGHRGVHNDSAQAYAIPNQFSRDQQLIQRSTLQPFIRVSHIIKGFFRDATFTGRNNTKKCE